MTKISSINFCSIFHFRKRISFNLSNAGKHWLTSSSLTSFIASTVQFNNFSGNKNYNPHKAYGHSKLANLLFANELARRFQSTSQTANAVHPGVIRTNLLRHCNPVLKHGSVLLEKLLFKNVQQGAATQVYLSTHPDLQGVSGEYYSNCNLKEPSIHGKDQIMAKKLWDFSEKIVTKISKGNDWKD